MSFEQQIRTNIFDHNYSRQREAFVFIIGQTLFTIHAVLKLGKISWIDSTALAGTLFSHVKCNKNI